MQHSLRKITCIDPRFAEWGSFESVSRRAALHEQQLCIPVHQDGSDHDGRVTSYFEGINCCMPSSIFIVTASLACSGSSLMMLCQLTSFRNLRSLPQSAFWYRQTSRSFRFSRNGLVLMEARRVTWSELSMGLVGLIDTLSSRLLRNRSSLFLHRVAHWTCC